LAGTVSHNSFTAWNAKYSLPSGGTIRQFIDGTGALQPLQNTVLILRPAGVAAGNVYTSFDSLYAAFLTTTGDVSIFVDTVYGDTIPATTTVYNFQNRAKFFGKNGGAYLTGASADGPWPTLLNAFYFEEVYVQDLYLDQTGSEGTFRFSRGGFQRVYFKKFSSVEVTNYGFAMPYFSLAAQAEFPGLGLRLLNGSQVTIATDSGDVVPNFSTLSILIDSSCTVAGENTLAHDTIQAKFLAKLQVKWANANPEFGLISHAGKTGIGFISGMALPEYTVQAAIKWLFDNRQTGGSFGATGSLVISSGSLSLVNDQTAPGANKVYGTDASGLKGWYDKGSGGSTAGVAMLAGPTNNTRQVFTGNHEFTGNTYFPSGIYAPGIFIGDNQNTLEIFTSQRLHSLTFPNGSTSAENWTYAFPNKSGTVALLSDIVAPNTSGFAQLASTQSFTGTNTFTQLVRLQGGITTGTGNTLMIQAPGGQTTFTFGVTANRAVTVPDKSGTLAMTSDLPTLTGYAQLSAAQTFAGANVFTSAVRLDAGIITGAADNELQFVSTNPAATTTFKFLATANRLQNVPDKDGTFAMLSDITAGGAGVNQVANYAALAAGSPGVYVVTADETESGSPRSLYVRTSTDALRVTFTAKALSTVEIVFRETFPNTSGAAADSGALGWVLMFSHPTTGAGQTFATPTTSIAAQAGAGATVPIGRTHTTDTNLGLLANTTAKNTFFAYTLTTISRATKALKSASFYIGHGRTSIATMICLRIGTTWYAHTSEFTNPVAISSVNDFAASAVYCETTFTAGATQWRTYNTSTSTLSGTLVTLPSGDITGVGVFMRDTASSTTGYRIDDVTLTLE
jgi:hypothetical protein